MRLSKALIQLYGLQDLIIKATEDPECSYPDLAKLALAWERLEERKRVLRGRPLPGSLKPDAATTKKKRGSISAVESGPATELWSGEPDHQAPAAAPEVKDHQPPDLPDQAALG